MDARGRRCPVPVLELARRLAQVSIGQVVTVLADDPAAGVDIPAWCRLRGQTYLGDTPAEGGGVRYQVRREA